MIPVKLEIENFGPFERTQVDFNFNSSLVVGEIEGVSGASNGSGKSNLLDAVTWSLTGNSKHKNSSDIIRRGSEFAKVALTFEQSGQIYRITRSRNKNNKVTLNFHKIHEDSEEEITADTNSMLDEKIVEITKITYDAFRNTSYFAQNSVSEFMYGTASTRQKLIGEILALDTWNDFAATANDLLKSHENRAELLKFKLGELIGVNAKISTLEDALDTAQASVEACEGKLTTFKAEQETIRSELRDAGDIAENERRSREKQEIIMFLATTNTDVSHKKARLLELERQATIETAKAQELSLQLVQAKEQFTPFDDELLSGAVEKWNAGTVKSQILRSQLATVEAGKCTSCGYDWKSGDHNHADVETKRSELAALEDKLAKAASKVADMREKRLASATIRSTISNLEGEIAKLQIAQETRSERIADLKNAIVSTETELLSKRLRLSDIPGEIDLSAVKALENRLSQVNVEIANLEKIKSESLVRIGSFTSSLDEARANQVKSSEFEQQLVSESENINIYSNLVKAFGKGGIQAVIVDNVIDELEKTANAYLSEFSYKPMCVRFVTQRKDTKGSWKETLDIEVMTASGACAFDNLSGGEQFRVAFAVRLALSIIQAKRLGGDLQLLMLDEVSSSLDKNGIEVFVSIIKRLQKQMKIMVITHDDALKEHFDTVITVKNKAGVSTITQS